MYGCVRVCERRESLFVCASETLGGERGRQRDGGVLEDGTLKVCVIVYMVSSVCWSSARLRDRCPVSHLCLV